MDRGRVRVGALLVGDVVLAMALFAPAWAHPASVTVGRKTDAPYPIWAMAWVARALGQGHVPWITHALAWPTGVNLLTNATAAGLGVLLAPVTWLWGPLVAYNVAATAALAATAASAQLVLRRVGLSWPAAAIGGLVGGFAPLAMSQTGAAHVHVSSAFLVPPLLLGVARLCDPSRTTSPTRWGVAIGLLSVAQLLIGEELLAIAVITAGIAVLAAAVLARPIAWDRLGRGLLVAGAIALPLAAWPLYVQFAGPGHLTGQISAGPNYPNDAVSAVIPSGLVWLSLGPIGRVARHFSTEGGVYFGLPLIVACAAVAVRRWRDAAVRVGAVTGVAVLVLSFGTHLVVGGHRTPLPLPWDLVASLPILQNLIPLRFGTVLSLFAGAGAAVAVDEVARWARAKYARPKRHFARSPAPAAMVLVPAAVVAACVLPLVPRLPSPTSRWNIPALFSAPRAAGIPDGSLVVLGPYPAVAHPEVEIWLAAARARWESAGGGYLVPGVGGRTSIGGQVSPSAVAETELEGGRSATSLAPERADVLAQLTHDRVAAVLIGPVAHRDEVVAWWTDLLGPPEPMGGVDVFRVG